MGSDPEITSVAASDLHTEVLPEETQRALSACIDFDFLEPDWYLAGGTALALQVAHRSSEDLDFFTQRKQFDIEFLDNALTQKGDWETTQTRAGTLHGILEGAKMSFIAYPFFHPSPIRIQCGKVQMLVPDDIMAMKIFAISQRGRKRDFVDMYWYCSLHRGSLQGTIRRVVAQFPGKEHNVPHFIKSLLYFEDAEDDPMPQLNFEADWEKIKAYFRHEVPKIAEELLGLKN